MKNRKTRIISTMLVLCLMISIIGLSACKKDDMVTSENLSLSDLEGWWARPDGYEADGISLVDYFEIDSTAGTWTIYNSLGEAAATYEARIENGQLVLEFALDDIIYSIGEDLTLLNENGEIEFIRGEALAEPDGSLYDGKWYKGGETEGYYYLFEGKTYKLFWSFNGEDQLFEEGTYTLMPLSIQLEDGGSLEGLTSLNLEIDGGGFANTSSLYVSDDKLVMQAWGTENDFYVRESAIGTSDGENAVIKYKLMQEDWSYNSGEGYRSLAFSFPNIFKKVVYPPEGGYGETEAHGTFETDGYNIYLYFSDGESDTAYLSEDFDAITLESSGEEYN